MKKLILAGILKKLNENFPFKRRLKIFFGLSLGGILLLGCIIVWAGITTVQKITDFGARYDVQEQVRNIRAEVTKTPAMAKAGCWQKIQDLITIQIWLEKPVAENINNLKTACLEKKPVK